MADEEETETTETAEQAGTGANTSERLTAVENAVERIEQAIGRLVPSSHQQAQEHTERRLDRPSRAEDVTRATVREELRKAQEDQAREQADASERETLQSRLARLEEKPPAEHRSPLKRIATHGWGG